MLFFINSEFVIILLYIKILFIYQDITEKKFFFKYYEMKMIFYHVSKNIIFFLLIID